MNIKNLTQYQLQQIAAQQNYLTESAAIEYMLYYLKIDWDEFWEKYLWSKI